jgi:hypothetical protein
VTIVVADDDCGGLLCEVVGFFVVVVGLDFAADDAVAVVDGATVADGAGVRLSVVAGDSLGAAEDFLSPPPPQAVVARAIAHVTRTRR